jgi:hypothetical protein
MNSGIIVSTNYGASVRITSIAAGDRTATIYFTNPLPATAYSYSLAIGGELAPPGPYIDFNPPVPAVPGGPLIINSGLENGTTYTVRIRGYSGAGGFSNPSNPVSVKPGAVPSAPQNVRVVGVAGIGQATVTWNPPSNTGGSSIVSYTITSSPLIPTVTPQSVGFGTLSVTLNGLQANTNYTFTVTATNEIGPGPGGSDNLGPPGPPQNLSTTGPLNPQPQTGQLTWSPPGLTGGYPIESYTITLSGGTTSSVNPQPVGSEIRSVTFNNLQADTTYTFTIVAINYAGPGQAASQTLGRAGPPSFITARMSDVGGDAKATVTWGPSSATNAFEISGYTADGDYNISPTTLTSTGASTYSVEFLAANYGIPYTFTAGAINRAGLGPLASATIGVPGAPSITSITSTPDIEAGPYMININFTPGADGGSPIINYSVTINGASTTNVPASIANPIQRYRLFANIPYSITIRAINHIGTSTIPSNEAFIYICASINDTPTATYGNICKGGFLFKWLGNYTLKYDPAGGNDQYQDPTNIKHILTPQKFGSWAGITDGNRNQNFAEVAVGIIGTGPTGDANVETKVNTLILPFIGDTRPPAPQETRLKDGPRYEVVDTTMVSGQPVTTILYPRQNQNWVHFLIISEDQSSYIVLRKCGIRSSGNGQSVFAIQGEYSNNNQNQTGLVDIIGDIREPALFCQNYKLYYALTTETC